MAELAARHYEHLFEAPTVVRPHPYVDSEPPVFDNHADSIPLVTYPEVLKVLKDRTKKRSCDAHVTVLTRPHSEELLAFLCAHVQSFILDLLFTKTIERCPDDFAREERGYLRAGSNASDFSFGLFFKSPRALISQSIPAHAQRSRNST